MRNGRFRRKPLPSNGANPRILDCQNERRSRHDCRGSAGDEIQGQAHVQFWAWPIMPLDNALLILGSIPFNLKSIKKQVSCLTCYLFLVEMMGIEPTTSALRTPRSPN